MRSGPAWFLAIETIGILSFAINAMIVSRAKSLSSIGIFFCAALTAFGGGTLRDILLGPEALPFFWVSFPFYIIAVFVLSMAYAHLSVMRDLIARRDVLVKETSEAIAMASSGALGALKCFDLIGPGDGSVLGTLHLLILCASLGAVSAGFGGVLRDVLLNDFPSLLRPGVWVLEAVFIAAALLAILRLAGVTDPWALLAGFLVALGIRGWAMLYGPRSRRAAAAILTIK